MLHAVRVALVVCLCVAVARSATALTFEFSGSVESVTDLAPPNNFLDDSVATAVVSGTYEVDVTTSDGSSPFTVGAAHLVFGLGNYGFDATVGSHSISLIDETGPPGSEVDLWQSGSLVVPDLIGGTSFSGNFVGYQARIEFFDNTASQFDGTETAPFVPGDLLGWSQVRIVLESLKDNGDGTTSFDGRVQVGVNLSSWGVQQVPEPQSSALFALGLVSLALRARHCKFRAASRRRAKAIRHARVR